MWATVGIISVVLKGGQGDQIQFSSDKQFLSSFSETQKDYKVKSNSTGQSEAVSACMAPYANNPSIA